MLEPAMFIANEKIATCLPYKLMVPAFDYDVFTIID